jgi:hypothetical protein
VAERLDQETDRNISAGPRGSHLTGLVGCTTCYGIPAKQARKEGWPWIVSIGLKGSQNHHRSGDRAFDGLIGGDAVKTL